MVAEAPSPIYQKVRDQGFRKAIVRLYEHRCAICGIRILTPEGHTVIEAAHIIPWSQTHNDSPQNGMSLCKLCHWSFDEGLMGVDLDYKVMVSPSVQKIITFQATCKCYLTEKYLNQMKINIGRNKRILIIIGI